MAWRIAPRLLLRIYTVIALVQKTIPDHWEIDLLAMAEVQWTFFLRALLHTIT
jgi:hypothetical protein